MATVYRATDLQSGRTVAIKLPHPEMDGDQIFAQRFQREQEIGLRRARGASRGNVIKLILKEAMTLAFVGLGIGLVGAYFVGRAMHSTLYGVGSLDYGAIAGVSFILLGASMFASWLPARRAASVEPMKALRTE